MQWVDVKSSIKMKSKTFDRIPIRSLYFSDKILEHLLDEIREQLERNFGEGYYDFASSRAYDSVF